MLRRFVLLSLAAATLLCANELRQPDLGKLSQKQFQELLHKSLNAAQMNKIRGRTQRRLLDSAA